MIIWVIVHHFLRSFDLFLAEKVDTKIDSLVFLLEQLYNTRSCYKVEFFWRVQIGEATREVKRILENGNGNPF
jgi:hypothetical protein